MSRHLMSVALAGVLAVGATTATTAYAELSTSVISTFRGQFVVSHDELPEGKNDKDTIAKIKQASLTELSGEPAGDVTAWHFHYTAFLTKTGASSLKMEFITDDAKHNLAADKQLEGVDPKSSVLTGDITIDEDEGLAKGKRYSVELVAGGNTVVSKQSVLFK